MAHPSFARHVPNLAGFRFSGRPSDDRDRQVRMGKSLDSEVAVPALLVVGPSVTRSLNEWPGWRHHFDAPFLPPNGILVPA